MPLPSPKFENSSCAEVRALFNAKAAKWNTKYQAGGALAFRVDTFEKLFPKHLCSNDKILDLGCGTGAIASVLAARGFRVTACDVAEKMIEVGKRIYAQSAIEWCLLPIDWKSLPFDASTFDGIIASSVLEYLSDVRGTLDECQRILKPGGVLIASVPDPRATIRNLEKVICLPVALLSHLGLNRIPKIRSYATYLKCSRNRMSLDEWVAIGAQAHFTATYQTEGDVPRGSLAFLVFAKGPK